MAHANKSTISINSSHSSFNSFIIYYLLLTLFYHKTGCWSSYNGRHGWSICFYLCDSAFWNSSVKSQSFNTWLPQSINLCLSFHEYAMLSACYHSLIVPLKIGYVFQVFFILYKVFITFYCLFLAPCLSV